MSDNPFEQQLQALLRGGAPAPSKMHNDASVQWANEERRREIQANRQSMTSRTTAARERKAAARTARIAEQERRLALQERQQAAALEASVRRDLAGAWEGSRADFERAFPALFEDYLKERVAINQATSRKQSAAYGAI
jgi:hypothetical protein